MGIYAVMVPENQAHIKEVQERCLNEGVDFRVKEYLGFDGEAVMERKYPEAIAQKEITIVSARPRSLLSLPAGMCFVANSDLYEKPYAHRAYFRPHFDIEQIHRPCLPRAL